MQENITIFILLVGFLIVRNFNVRLFVSFLDHNPGPLDSVYIAEIGVLFNPDPTVHDVCQAW